MSAQDQKIALVTGASRGLGRSIAESLARKGYRVVINFANSKKDAKHVVESIVSQGGEAVAEQADIRNDQEIRTMVGLTRALATEFGPWGITVNLIAPGWIPVERHAGTPENLLEAYRSRVPLGRFGTPGDIGTAVAYLAGEDAGFVTGQCLAVNGGNTF